MERTKFASWSATIGKDGLLYFHPRDVPVRVWAVSVQPAGVIWADAEIVRITESHVIARYTGETARLNRWSLVTSWAVWRGVMFVSSRTGRAARMFDAMWQARYGRAAGGVPPAMQMPLADAIKLLRVPDNYTKEDVETFRREVKKAHPDVGGTAEQFRKLVEARDRLLTSLGTSAPPPRPPEYAPNGMQVIFRSVKLGGQNRLGAALRLSRASCGGGLSALCPLTSQKPPHVHSPVFAQKRRTASLSCRLAGMEAHRLPGGNRRDHRRYGTQSARQPPLPRHRQGEPRQRGEGHCVPAGVRKRLSGSHLNRCQKKAPKGPFVLALRLPAALGRLRPLQGRFGPSSSAG